MPSEIISTLTLDDKPINMKGRSDDLITKHWVATGQFYELGELERLTSFLKRVVTDKSVIVDAGANLGNHTVYFGLNIPGVKIFSFEINPVTFQFLKWNVDNNGVEGAEALNIGLSDSEGRCGVASDADNPLGGARVDMASTEQNAVLKPMDLCLESARREDGAKVELIKIDIEGHEVECLQGAATILKEDRPLVYLECKETHQYEVIAKMLGEQGYMLIEAAPGHLPNFLFAHREEAPNLFIPEELDAIREEFGRRVVDAWQLVRALKRKT